jgi:hypothetical protein
VLTVAALVAGSVAVAWAAARVVPADARDPTPDEARVLEALNARRRAAGARPLEWDRAAGAVVREMFRSERRPDTAALDRRLESARGLDARWTWSSRAAKDPAEAAGDLDAELLSRNYTHGAAAFFDDVGVAGMLRVVVLVLEVPPLVGRRNANGQAGRYRFHCASCGKEFVYSVDSKPGTQFECPACKTLVSPYLEDTGGVLHWPTWYVAPYAPFATTNPFLIWQWVNQKVRYDHAKRDHSIPGWQTPRETNDKGTGVCRDTAVMMAAWLRHAEKDARVVVGLDPLARRHAWAVLTDGETRYLLETAFDGSMNRRYPPRLELETRYVPSEMQFDDSRVWLNRGQQTTRDYDSPRIWLAVQEAP